MNDLLIAQEEAAYWKERAKFHESLAAHHFAAFTKEADEHQRLKEEDRLQIIGTFFVQAVIVLVAVTLGLLFLRLMGPGPV